jgi:hypothetical protein
LPDVFYSVAIRVQGKDLAPFAQQMHQVTSVPTAGIEYTHTRCDIPAQDLIEHVDVNLPKLFLDA